MHESDLNEEKMAAALKHTALDLLISHECYTYDDEQWTWTNTVETAITWNRSDYLTTDNLTVLAEFRKSNYGELHFYANKALEMLGTAGYERARSIAAQ